MGHGADNQPHVGMETPDSLMPSGYVLVPETAFDAIDEHGVALVLHWFVLGFVMFGTKVGWFLWAYKPKILRFGWLL